MILIGILLIQFGAKYDVISLVTIATLFTGFTVCMFINGLILPASSPQYIVWITIVMSFFIGLGAGYGVYAWPKAGVISIGASMGALLGTLIYVMFMSGMTGNAEVALGLSNKKSTETVEVNGVLKTYADIQSEEMFQLMMSLGFCIFICSALAVAFYEQAVLFGTSVIGSYLLIRGLAVMFGGFPNEFMVYDAIRNQAFMSNNRMMFVYILAMLILATLSIKRQASLRKTGGSLHYKKYDFKYRKPIGNPGTGDDIRRIVKESNEIENLNKSGRLNTQKYGMLFEDEAAAPLSRRSEDHYQN
jgi:hypothetical protein